MPYYNWNDNYLTNGSASNIGYYFCPNRQVPSPIIFGTLPTANSSGNLQPWQSLCLCPNPAMGPTHPGLKAPKDELFMDLFWMPVVQPYAISEALSTAGKVNLNYQIMPFTYINRQTGLYAVMKSTKVTAIPSSTAANGQTDPNLLAYYKSFYYLNSNYPNLKTRYNIDIGQTLQQFDTWFNSGKNVFVSATQICDQFLVPVGQTLANVASSGNALGTFWQSQQLTGINSREEPYGQIYPRVTTQSNTFQVHMRVQTVTQTPADIAAGVFNSSTDAVTGEYRGSAIIERYIDPNDTTLPDFATAYANSPTAANTLDGHYKFRIVTTTAFAP